MGIAPPKPSEDEAVLAGRIAAAAPGIDRDAESALYRQLAPRVRRYGLRHLRDPHAAADLMQHVMMMVIEKLRAGALRDPAMLASFVFGTCRLVVLDLRRGASRRERLLGMYANDLSIADIAVAPRLDDDRVERCLDTLPERERSVLVMSFHDEKDADQVGRELGLSAGNVRVIRHRALNRLRECVLGKGAPP